MIELNEKADIYAEENVINVLKEAFAKVYADGYRDGYKDCLDHVSVNLRISNTEYVDLGLPSGTLWSADYERKRMRMYSSHIYWQTLKQYRLGPNGMN